MSIFRPFPRIPSSWSSDRSEAMSPLPEPVTSKKVEEPLASKIIEVHDSKPEPPTPSTCAETDAEVAEQMIGLLEDDSVLSLSTAAFETMVEKVVPMAQLRAAQAERSEGATAADWEALLKGGMENGVPTGKTLSQRMMRALSPEEKVEYDNLGKGYAAKAAWRKQWAAKKYDALVKEKTEIQRWTKTDTNLGTYLSLSRIIEEEGGKSPTHADISAGKLYVLRCVQLAGDWISMNPMTRRYDYLYMAKSRREEFNHSWELLRKEVSKGTATLKAPKPIPMEEAETVPATQLAAELAAASLRAAGDEVNPVDSQQATPKPKAKPKAKGKGKVEKSQATKRTTTPQKRPGGKKPKTDFEVKAMDAEVTSNCYMSVTGQANHMVQAINTSPSWSWGKTADYLGALEAMVAKLPAIVESLPIVGQSFMLGCSITDLVASHGEAVVLESLLAIKHLQDNLDQLKALIDKTSAMHMIHSRK